MTRIVLAALAIIAIAAAPTCAAIYDLGLSGTIASSPTGLATDGSTVSYNYNSNGFLFDTATGVSTQISTGYGTTGVAKMGSTILASGNSSGVASVYSSASGSWSALPLYGGTTNWTTASTTAIAASATQYWVGGSVGSGNPNVMSCWSHDGFTGDTGSPSGWQKNMYCYGTSDTGNYFCRGSFNAPTGVSGAAREAFALSYDGSSVVALKQFDGNIVRTIEETIIGVSRDGHYGVGWINNLNCYWDLSTGNATAVPMMSGGYSVGYMTAANGDGSKMFGWQRIGSDAATVKGVIYDRATNTTSDLMSYLASKGVDMAAAGWYNITNVVSVSADGKVITGSGKLGSSSGVAHGFVVVIPEPASILALVTGLIGLVGLRRKVK